MLSQDILKRYLHYNPETGIFTWKIRPHNRSKIKPGDKAGGDDGEGYIRIQIKGTSYRANRLAFLYMTGEFPPCLTDHENRIRSDNSWNNLRHATYSQNCKNVGALKNNTLGFKGIYKSGNRWIARAMHNKKFHYLGCFKTPEEAGNAYREFAKKIHGKFYNESAK